MITPVVAVCVALITTVGGVVVALIQARKTTKCSLS